MSVLEDRARRKRERLNRNPKHPILSYLNLVPEVRYSVFDILVLGAGDAIVEITQAQRPHWYTVELKLVHEGQFDRRTVFIKSFTGHIEYCARVVNAHLMDGLVGDETQ